jgi:hypothetical protein
MRIARRNLNAPAQATWIIALLVGMLGILMHARILRITGLGIESFWLVAAAFVLLLIASLVRGL